MATHNVAWLQCAPRRHFFVKSLLHLCKFLVNPKFDQETNYIFRKPMDSCFQPCIVCAEILWTFHTWIEYMHTLKNAIQTSGGKKLPKPSLPLRGCGPHLIHPSVERPMHSPPQTASRSNQQFASFAKYTLGFEEIGPMYKSGLGDRSVFMSLVHTSRIVGPRQMNTGYENFSDYWKHFYLRVSFIWFSCIVAFSKSGSLRGVLESWLACSDCLPRGLYVLFMLFFAFYWSPWRQIISECTLPIFTKFDIVLRSLKGRCCGNQRQCH